MRPTGIRLPPVHLFQREGQAGPHPVFLGLLFIVICVLSH